MSRSAPATEAEIRATFDQLLASGGNQGMPTATGLDADTRAAIERYWDAPSLALHDAAQRELEMQLDGTHAREAEARQAAVFNTP